jgi:anti-sigma regulatory factor (Ser/Thr protein kinase)
MELNFSVSGDDFISAGEASTKIKKTLRQVGINPEIIRRIAIAVYEAEMNVVIHADSGDILVELLNDKVCIKVVDKGPGIANISLAMQEGYTTASEEARRQGFGAGMGLPNIKRTSDEFEINSTVGVGTELLMVFYL